MRRVGHLCLLTLTRGCLTRGMVSLDSPPYWGMWDSDRYRNLAQLYAREWLQLANM